MVTAQKKISSIGFKLDSATEAVKKLDELKAEGFQALVMDVRGRECSRMQLEAQAADELRGCRGNRAHDDMGANDRAHSEADVVRPR